MGLPARCPTLLILHAQGAVQADWWAPRLQPLADLVTIYRHDMLHSEDEEQVILDAGEAVAIDESDDPVAVATALRRDRSIDGVLTFSEPLLHAAADIAEALSLPHHTVEAVRRMQLKDVQRATLTRAGLPCPEHVVIETPADLTTASTKLRFPVVLKPVWGFGSAATVLVDRPEDLKLRYGEARELYESDWRLAGRGALFLVEEFINGARYHDDPRMGDMVSVESLLHHGTMHHLTVTDKFPLVRPFRETGDIMPSWLPGARVEQILASASDAIRAVGASHGAIHTEIKLTKEGPRIIEINGRLGGYMARLLDAAFEYDVVAEIARIALGFPPTAPRWTKRYVADLNLISPAEDVMLLDVEGIRAAERVSGVRSLSIYGLGGVPAWRLGGGCYGYVEAEADEPHALLDIRDQVLATLRLRTTSPAKGRQPISEPT